jgi:hypothetical protein
MGNIKVHAVLSIKLMMISTEFCDVREEESRRVAHKMHDIEKGVVKRQTYGDVTIPMIPNAYRKWVEDNSE